MDIPSLIIELIWFAASIFCLKGGLRNLFHTNADHKTGGIFLILAVISFFMFILRLKRNSKK